MTRKIINLSNYVCDKYSWYVATQGIWIDMQNENPRLRRWINPPPIEPLAYFFRIDAASKGWIWSDPLENCYGFLITYYADPNLIILTGNEPGGKDEMVNDTLPQPQTPGMIQVNWNIPFLAELDRLLSDFLESLGLGVDTWVVYVILGTLVYVKVK